MNWRYLFYELNGDGTETFIKGDVPVTGGPPVRKLSTPHEITGTIRPADAPELVSADGSTRLRRWQTTCYVADDTDRIWAGGVLNDFHIDGPSLNFDFAGFTSYIKDQPYDGEHSAIQEDPLDLTRLLWSHFQNQPGGNLGLEIDDTRSPVRIGTPPRDVSFDTSTGDNVNFTANDGAVMIDWWETGDSAGLIDDWAKNTPFDYLEQHIFDGDTVRHFLQLGYPSIGEIRDLHRFVLGENVQVIPTEDYLGDDVVTEVWVFGKGEGRDRVRGIAKLIPKSGLRRVKTFVDSSIQNTVDAQNIARQILTSYQPQVPGAGVTTLLVKNHVNAEFGTFDVGDTIPYSGDHNWGDVLVWVKILSISLMSNGMIQAAVVRADTLI